MEFEIQSGGCFCRIFEFMERIIQALRCGGNGGDLFYIIQINRCRLTGCSAILNRIIGDLFQWLIDRKFSAVVELNGVLPDAGAEKIRKGA